LFRLSKRRANSRGSLDKSTTLDEGAGTGTGAEVPGTDGIVIDVIYNINYNKSILVEKNIFTIFSGFIFYFNLITLVISNQ
jgi:hypothetical protein